MTTEDFSEELYVSNPVASWNARKCLAIALPLSMAVGSPLEAAEWYAEPSMQGSVEYDDNRRLRVERDEAELSELFMPELLLGVRTPVLDLRTAARAEVIHSSDGDLNRTNLFARLFGNYLTQRGRWDVDANWRRDTTLTTVIVDPLAPPGEMPAPDAVVDPVIGVERDQVERNRIRFRPAYTHQLTELTELGLGYRFSDTSYDQNVRRLVDSTSHRVLGGISYKLTPIDNLIGRAEYGRFDSDITSFDQYGAWAGVNHRFSETLFGEVLVGFKRTESTPGDKVAGNDTSDTSFVVNATAEKRFETGRALAIFQRDVSEGPFGAARRTEQLDIRYDWEIVPERWLFTFGSQVFRNRSLDLGETVEEDRIYVQVQPRIRWQITRQLYLDFSYRYRFNDNENARASADANAALIGLQYVLDRLAM